MKAGLICGMDVERRALGALQNDSRLMTGISAADPNRASRIAAEMVSDGADVLISWGIAGGLSPDLPSATLVVPHFVIDTDGAELPSIGLSMRGKSGAVLIAGSDVLISTQAEKRALQLRSDAVAVDMESHRVARVALEKNLPCMVIRAVSDPAERALPDGVEHALDDDGKPRILPMLLGLMRHPGRLPALLAAKRDLDGAIQTLSSLGTNLLEEMLTQRNSESYRRD